MPPALRANGTRWRCLAIRAQKRVEQVRDTWSTLEGGDLKVGLSRDQFAACDGLALAYPLRRSRWSVETLFYRRDGNAKAMPNDGASIYLYLVWSCKPFVCSV